MLTIMLTIMHRLAKGTIHNPSVLFLVPWLFLPMLFSCMAEHVRMASDIDSAHFISEAYNMTQSNPLIHVLRNENVYDITAQSRAHILISNRMPPRTVQQNLQPLNKPNHSQIIVPLRNKKVSLLAFSLPLIVTLKSSNNTLPRNGSITLSELYALLQKTPNNARNNTWVFPLQPHESFQHVFPNNDAYEQWMHSISEKFAHDVKIYSRRYATIPLLAIIKDISIAYKFMPSHTFFNQPPSFRSLFSIAILTDDENNTPIIDPVFISVLRNKPYGEIRSARKVLRWLMSSDTHNEILDFTREIFQDAPSATQFLNRTYSNNKETTAVDILPRNAWLATHAPLYSSLYFARNE